MKTFWNILLVVFILGIFILIAVNWDKIVSWWKRPSEGSKCILASEPAYVEGVIKNGQCISKNQNNSNGNGNGNGNPPSTQYDLEVSNPSGAYMYYRSVNTNPGHEGVVNYGKSNVLIPFGQKLNQVGTVINTYQGLPSQVIETTYKQYGATSGFFDIKDLKKL